MPERTLAPAAFLDDRTRNPVVTPAVWVPLLQIQIERAWARRALVYEPARCFIVS
jgi:hypothetical protein